MTSHRDNILPLITCVSSSCYKAFQTHEKATMLETGPRWLWEKKVTGAGIEPATSDYICQCSKPLSYRVDKIVAIAQWLRALTYIVRGCWFNSSPCHFLFPRSPRTGFQQSSQSWVVLDSPYLLAAAVDTTVRSPFPAHAWHMELGMSPSFLLYMFVVGMEGWHI